MKIEIRPRAGAGPIRFGMQRDDVRRLLGDPIYSAASKDFFADGDVHVHYTPLMLVELIVVTGQSEALFEGLDLLHVPADEAIEALTRISPLDSEDAEYPLSCTFLDIDVNLWRSCLPEDDAGRAGGYFEAVGVGAAGYFSRRRPG